MKNLIIAGVIGTLFMAGGFYVGMRLTPPAPAKAEVAKTASAPADATAPAPDAISLDTLRKTSETMMSLSEALATREKNVAEREQKVKQKEDEIEAERAALDRTHEKFKGLFAEFQQRLQLVEASQRDQLQKQSELYASMNIDQSIDMIRAMDDPAVSRLFSVMETKPLAKMVSAWRLKYPDDAQRLLRALDGMSRVLPKEEIALNDSPAPSGIGNAESPAPTAPAPAANAPADSSAPDAAPTTPTDATPATPATTTPTSADAPPAAASTDPNSTATQAAAQPLAPPPDQPAPADSTSAPADSTKAPVSTATTN